MFGHNGKLFQRVVRLEGKIELKWKKASTLQHEMGPKSLGVVRLLILGIKELMEVLNCFIIFWH